MIGHDRSTQIQRRRRPLAPDWAQRRRARLYRQEARQLNDPYVQEAKRLGYRSRAAFKLAQLDDKCRLLKPGMRVVDLGAAPGGWTQIVVERTRAESSGAKIIALDILPMDPIAPALVLQLDFLEPDAPAKLLAAIDGQADLVLSDMAASSTGHRATDHIRIIALAEIAYDFAAQILAPGGAFVAKVFQAVRKGNYCAG